MYLSCNISDLTKNLDTLEPSWYDPNLQDTSRVLDMVERQELAAETCNIVLL